MIANRIFSKLSALVVLFTLGLGVSQPVPVSANGNTIILGVGASTTGAPELGWPEINSVQLAIDLVNAAGGIEIGGTAYTVNLVSANDGCNESQGAAAATALLNAGAVAVVGYTCSNASLGADNIHAAAGVAMISPSSTSPWLTKQGYNTTFRTISQDDRAASLLPIYMRTMLNLKKAAIVERNGFWFLWATDAISTTFVNLGGVITSKRGYDSTADFNTLLAAIQPEDPDVIFVCDVDADNAGQFSSAAHDLGMTGVVIAWDSFGEDRGVLATYETAAGAAALGDYAGMFYRNPADMPGYATFNALYQAKGFPNYGGEATTVGAFAYDAANIIMAAIRRAQSTNPSEIRDAIAATMHFSGVVGEYIGFDPYGDVIPQWAWLERYETDQWVMQPFRMLFLPTVLR